MKGTRRLLSVNVLGPVGVLEGTTSAYTGQASYSDGTLLGYSNTVWNATRFTGTNARRFFHAVEAE